MRDGRSGGALFWAAFALLLPRPPGGCSCCSKPFLAFLPPGTACALLAIKGLSTLSLGCVPSISNGPFCRLLVARAASPSFLPSFLPHLREHSRGSFIVFSFARSPSLVAASRRMHRSS